jgi:hypothetical protein
MALNLALAAVAGLAALFFIREALHRLYAIGAIRSQCESGAGSA